MKNNRNPVITGLAKRSPRYSLKRGFYMKTPMYATEDAIWLDVFGVVRDSVERDPELIDALELYLEVLEEMLRDEDARSDGKKRPS